MGKKTSSATISQNSPNSSFYSTIGSNNSVTQSNESIPSSYFNNTTIRADNNSNNNPVGYGIPTNTERFIDRFNFTNLNNLPKPENFCNENLNKTLISQISACNKR